MQQRGIAPSSSVARLASNSSTPVTPLAGSAEPGVWESVPDDHLTFRRDGGRGGACAAKLIVRTDEEFSLLRFKTIPNRHTLVYKTTLGVGLCVSADCAAAAAAASSCRQIGGVPSVGKKPGDVTTGARPPACCCPPPYGSALIRGLKNLSRRVVFSPRDCTPKPRPAQLIIHKKTQLETHILFGN